MKVDKLLPKYIKPGNVISLISEYGRSIKHFRFLILNGGSGSIHAVNLNNDKDNIQVWDYEEESIEEFIEYFSEGNYHSFEVHTGVEISLWDKHDDFVFTHIQDTPPPHENEELSLGKVIRLHKSSIAGSKYFLVSAQGYKGFNITLLNKGISYFSVISGSLGDLRGRIVSILGDYDVITLEEAAKELLESK